jgi:ATP-dependent Clp protease, protease subunit
MNEFFLDSEIMSSRELINFLSSQNGDATIYINSSGGSVQEASAIVTAFGMFPHKITCVVSGWALSSASFIACAANTVLASKTALMMLHNPTTDAYGDSEELLKASDVLSKVKSMMIEVYDTRLKLGADSVSSMMDAETWYTADEALDVGLIDGIVDIKNPPTTHAVSIKAFKNPPQQFLATLNPLKSERSRIIEMLKITNTWVKKGYTNILALQEKFIANGADIATIKTEILAELGSMATPLNSTPPNTLNSAITAYLKINPTKSYASATAEVLKLNPKLYEG